MQAVEERVCDQAVLALIRTLLRAGVMEGGSLRRRARARPRAAYVQLNISRLMNSAGLCAALWLLALVTATPAVEHCA